MLKTQHYHIRLNEELSFREEDVLGVHYQVAPMLLSVAGFRQE